MKIIRVKTQLPDLVSRFTSITDAVSKHVVGREPELNALKICLLTNQHLLLEGLPGIAKSRFALLAFRAFTGAQTFRLMFHGSTSSDDVLGPLNPKVLRESGRIEYNMERMLPTAHFAYLDELFNGSPATLNCCLNILNERVITAGGHVYKCPLQTSVVTTNKIPSDVELAALLDRFLITRSVKPASSESERRMILSAFESSESVDDVIFPDTMSLKELQTIQAAVRKVKVPPQFVTMLEATRNSYTATSGQYVSDRRYVWAYRAIQAAILLLHSGEMVSRPSTDALTVLADVLSRRTTDVESIESSICSSLQLIEQAESEAEELEQLESKLRAKINSFDTDWSDIKKRKTLRTVTTVLTRMQGLPAEQQFRVPEHADKFRALMREAESFQLELETQLGFRTADGNLTQEGLEFSTEAALEETT